MPALQSGSRLGSYEILAPIGSGGMGEVYRARDLKLKRDAAQYAARRRSHLAHHRYPQLGRSG